MNIKSAAQQFYDYSKYLRGYSKDTLRKYRHAIHFGNFSSRTEWREIGKPPPLYPTSGHFLFFSNGALLRTI